MAEELKTENQTSSGPIDPGPNASVPENDALLDDLFSDAPPEMSMVDPKDQKQDEKTEEKQDEKPEEQETKIDDLDIPEDLGLEEAPSPEENQDIEKEFPEPENLDDKAKHSWGDLRAQLKEARRQLEDVQSKSGDEKIKQLEAELESMKDQINRTDYLNSDEFKNKYDLPIKSKFATVGKMLKELEIDPKIALDAMRMNTKDRLEHLLSEAPQIAPTLMNMMGDVDQMLAAKAEAVKEWKTNKIATDERIAKETEANKSREIQENLIAAVSDLRADNNIYYMQSKNNENWNKSVESRIDKAANIIKSGDMKLITKLVLDGITAGSTRSELSKANALIKSMSEKGGKAANLPGLGGGEGSSEGKPAAKKTENMTDEEILDSLFSS